MKSDRTSAQRRYQQEHDTAAFERVISIYLDCAALPHLAACRYDGEGKRTLSPGTSALDFKIDTELANRRVLTTPEMQCVWQRLVEGQYKATNQPTKAERALESPDALSAEQRALTDRVIQLCSREYKRRGLDKVGQYFTRIRRKAEA